MPVIIPERADHLPRAGVEPTESEVFMPRVHRAVVSSVAVLLVSLSPLGAARGDAEAPERVALVAQQTDTTVYKPGNGVSLPTVVKQVQPQYTSEAMEQRIEGTVELECVVRTDGRVSDIKVVRSLDSVYGLDRNAVDAMAKWEFKPGTKDDKPVAVQIAVQMKYTLK